MPIALTLLRQFWYLIPILLLTASTMWFRHDAHQEHAQRIEVQAAYDVFKSGVEQLGKAQIERNKVIAITQEKVNRETVKSADARVNSILDRYNRLLNKPSDPGRGNVSSVPDTARPATDAARDSRLLEVLRAADLQTGQLIELQDWVKKSR